MIRWVGLPRGTRATVYLNRDDVAETLRLPAGRAGGAKLRPVGRRASSAKSGRSRTCRCRLRRTSIPALLTIELPAARGEHYRVIVHQVSGETRAVVGTFELSVPERHARELLWDEEDKLAIFRWVEHSLDNRARWAPVLRRYIAQTADRVSGFGGNPDESPASPNEAGTHHHNPRIGCLALLLTL